MDWRSNGSYKRTVRLSDKEIRQGAMRCHLERMNKGRVTLYVIPLSLQHNPAQSRTCPQSRLFRLKCFEDIFNVGLLNIEY